MTEEEQTELYRRTLVSAYMTWDGEIAISLPSDVWVSPEEARLIAILLNQLADEAEACQR